MQLSVPLLGLYDRTNQKCRTREEGTATFETLRETEGPAKYTLRAGAFGELIAARFYQINAVVAEATQIADTFVAFLERSQSFWVKIFLHQSALKCFLQS